MNEQWMAKQTNKLTMNKIPALGTAVLQPRLPPCWTAMNPLLWKSLYRAVVLDQHHHPEFNPLWPNIKLANTYQKFQSEQTVNSSNQPFCLQPQALQLPAGWGTCHGTHHPTHTSLQLRPRFAHVYLGLSARWSPPLQQLTTIQCLKATLTWSQTVCTPGVQVGVVMVHLWEPVLPTFLSSKAFLASSSLSLLSLAMVATGHCECQWPMTVTSCWRLTMHTPIF